MTLRVLAGALLWLAVWSQGAGDSRAESRQTGQRPPCPDLQSQGSDGPPSLRAIDLTQQDVARLKPDLLARLRASNVEYRDRLVDRTVEAPVFLDVEGCGRIGSWRLQNREAVPVLISRISSGRSVIIQAVATVVKIEGEWRIGGVEIERITLRRQ